MLVASNVGFFSRVCDWNESLVQPTKQCSLIPNQPIQPWINTLWEVCEFGQFSSLLAVRTLRGSFLRSLLQVQRNALVCLSSAKTSRSWMEMDSQQMRRWVNVVTRLIRTKLKPSMRIHLVRCPLNQMLDKNKPGGGEW